MVRELLRILPLVSLALAAAPQSDNSAADLEHFEKRVRPVLATHCYSCHGPDKQFANLRLDSRDRILKGGDRGPAVSLTTPLDSLLLKAVRHDGAIKMPLGAKLKPDEIAALEQWVKQGLAWPADLTNTKLGAGDPGFYERIRREHWAFQPVANPPVPAGAQSNPIDRFIAAKLRAKGLAKAQPADRATLARRAAYVLTGLPLTPAELHAFLAENSPAAYERLIDRLLASPHFGERWARHWMDLMRYAETYGYEWNFEIQGAWRYRDYLIRAFNADLPYDSFVREHLAGDLLAKPRTLDGKTNESLLATAFYRLGEMGHDNCNQFPEIRTDVVDNQIDTLTKAFQGVTVSCARCHDHKIDPIPTEDYYALYGILNSARPVTQTLDLQGPAPSQRAKLDQLKSQIKSRLADAWLAETAQFAEYLGAAIEWEKDSAAAPASAAGLAADRIARFQQLLRRPKLDLADPLYPAIAWMRDPSAAEWRKLTEKYQTESAARRKFNADTFTTFADFRTNAQPGGWTRDGWGLDSGHARDGSFAIATEGGDALAGVYSAGLFTNLLSDRLNGVLRSPMLPKDKKFLTLEVAGGQLGALRLIMDGCVIGEDHQLLKNSRLDWVRLSSKSDQPLPTYLEITTKLNNPRLPERPEKFNDLTEAQFESPRSFWGVTRILLHDAEASPKDELQHLLPLLEAAPASIPDLAKRLEQRIQTALRAWIKNQASAADVRWIDWLLKNQLLTNSRNLTPELRALTDAYRQAESELATPAVVSSMADIDRGSDYPILLGGQYKSPGRPAPRHFLSLMPAALRPVNPAFSGRREMAEAIASKDNPLTARVMVNRVWHHVFGRGLSSTTDNFGRYGEAPTHPELLDYLSARFVNDGWSVKRLIRSMMLSDTFMQSSVTTSQAESADPQNLLWSRYPVRRLEAEGVRDSILAASGSLDRRLFGPAIQPHRDEPAPYRRLFQGPLDGNGRRSIYLKITRMQGPRFLETFDFPAPLQTRGNRDVTNVPSQSLALLNDPFVVAQAKAWAQRLVTTNDSADHRLRTIFETALSRPPLSTELARFQNLIRALAQERKLSDAEIPANVPLWKDVTHAVFNMKEFVYLN